MAGMTSSIGKRPFIQEIKYQLSRVHDCVLRGSNSRLWRVQREEDIMETITHNKIKKLIKKFDQFEEQPGDFEVVDDILARADQCLREGKKYKSKQMTAACHKLEGRKVSLIYRTERDEDLSVPHTQDYLKHELNQKMVDWIYVYPGFNPDSHDRDPERKIIEVCERYPAYANLLLKDEKLLIEFFKWAIRDNNQVAPMVMFASLQELLKRCNISQRTGYNAGEDLRIKTDYDREGHILRSLWLPIEATPQNIAERDKKVTLKDGSERTIEEILELFKNKVHTPGDLEFFPRVGITYWPSYEPWKVMNVASPTFWHEGPQLRILDVEEAQNIYGKTVPGLKIIEPMVPLDSLIEHEEDGTYWMEHDRFLFNEVEPIEWHGSLVKVRMRERIPVDGKNFIQVVRATKEKDMSFLRTHSFGDILIPLESGRYYLFNMGKYPKFYPETTYRLLSSFVKVVLAVLQIVDDNVFFNHRNHTRECIGLKPEEGRVLLEIVRFLLILARDDKLGFEFQTEGCAKMLQVDIVKTLIYITTTFEEISDEEIKKKITELLYTPEMDQYDLDHVPNFFRTTLDKVNPEGALGIVFTLIKKCFYWMQPYLVSLTYLIIGVWRGMTFQIGGRAVKLSHMRSSCWHDGSSYKHSLYHPGYMHQQQEDKGITLLRRKLDLIKLPFYKD
ncbi:MAG: hypothetical protein K940chlam3_00041 [Chlamydiae bacterium]|nr:hypothetical protein [Chlamydiota bacterium]